MPRAAVIRPFEAETYQVSKVQPNAHLVLG